MASCFSPWAKLCLGLSRALPEVKPVSHDPVSALSILRVAGPNVNTYFTPPPKTSHQSRTAATQQQKVSINSLLF